MAPEEGKRIIEIKGTKFEVDLRQAVRVETLCVGDRVSVLKKEYAASYKTHHGVVVGFEPFSELPTIVVAYMASDYSGAEVKTLVFNEKTEDVELVKATDDVLFDKEDAIRSASLRVVLASSIFLSRSRKKAYFLRHFGRYWRDAEDVESVRRAQLGEDA